MTSFLFIISFLLHIISITAIYALSKQLSGAKQHDNTELVSLMESYLEEIKEENKILQEKLAKEDKDESHKTNTTTPNIKAIRKEEKETYLFPKIEDEALDQVEVSLQSKILKLHQEGNSPEEIARILACGKTEVELLLKFQEKS
jgi:DNA-directed RNA polymerase specialized sigma24 family protein